MRETQSSVYWDFRGAHSELRRVVSFTSAHYTISDIGVRRKIISLLGIQPDRRFYTTLKMCDAPAAKPAKAKKAAKPKKPAAHPPVASMVTAAIKNLKDRKGSSLAAIKKYISANYKCDVAKLAPFMRKFLKKAVADGKLTQVKGTGASGSFKVAASAKAEKPKKKAVKKPKKPAAKKAKKPAGEKAKKPAAKKAKSPKKAAKPKKAKTPKKAAKPKKAKTPKKAAKPKKAKTPKKAKKPTAKKAAKK